MGRVGLLARAMNLAPVTDPDHQNQQAIVVDLVEDPVGADPKAIGADGAAKLASIGWSRLARQCIDHGRETSLQATIQPP
jgi:hypothetical protein